MLLLTTNKIGRQRGKEGGFGIGYCELEMFRDSWTFMLRNKSEIEAEESE